MKYFKNLLVLAVVLTGVSGMASAAANFPQEVLVLMSSPEYAVTFENIRQNLAPGTDVRVSGGTVQKVGQTIFAIVSLKKTVLAIEPPQYTNLGEIIGLVEYSPRLHVTSVYFKPAAQLP